LANANKTSAVLAERGDQIASLINDSNDLLVALQSQSAALDQISANIAAAANQIKGLIDDNKQTLKPSLDKLNGALAIVENRKSEVQKAINGFNDYALSLGESVGSGPFFKAYIANLMPGQFVQPFIDAAFSDLGLDPNVLSPSQRVDPPVGQRGTPALPIPYPRTGQVGEPNLTLPDAITGKPGDPRYPYREPLPAPAPGGPPPGPPAPAAPGVVSTPTPEPTSVDIPLAPPQLPIPAQLGEPDAGPIGSGAQEGQ
jgi:phospholipid/cholesterol/gamma-HCH transport system substrate-binding protein